MDDVALVFGRGVAAPQALGRAYVEIQAPAQKNGRPPKGTASDREEIMLKKA